MYQLKLVPETKSGKNELTDEVYWYPLKVDESTDLVSVNVTTQSMYNRLEERWTRGGRIIISSPIAGVYECFLYFGTIGDPRIVPMFGERPLLVKDQSIYYFFSDDDFDDIYRKIDVMESGPEVGDVGIRTKQKSCLDFFEKCLSPDWNSSLKHIKPERINRDMKEYGFHTNKIGLHPLLQLIQLIPQSTWDKEYYKEMFIFLFKNDFLVSWIDDIENTDKKEDVLQKCEKLSNGEITTIPEFKNILKEITKQLVGKHEFFGMLYLAAQSANESSVFKAFFNNLFELVPKEQKKWINYPKFQPKLIVDGIEVHFIQKAGSPATINRMTDALKKIFDKIDFYGAGYPRYRFICKVTLPARDYSLLPDRVGAIYDAVRTIARDNHLSEPTKEMWVKRIAVRFITPPQFEDDVLLAFSKNWFFRRRSRKFDELDEENRRKTLKADIICDYSVYQDGEFIFPFKYSQDVQNSYVALNDLLFKNHNFTQFGEMKSLTE